jgi:hypothetical protein
MWVRLRHMRTQHSCGDIPCSRTAAGWQQQQQHEEHCHRHWRKVLGCALPACHSAVYRWRTSAGTGAGEQQSNDDSAGAGAEAQGRGQGRALPVHLQHTWLAGPG